MTNTYAVWCNQHERYEVDSVSGPQNHKVHPENYRLLDRDKAQIVYWKNSRVANNEDLLAERDEFPTYIGWDGKEHGEF